MHLPKSSFQPYSRYGAAAKPEKRFETKTGAVLRMEAAVFIASPGFHLPLEVNFGG
jgi:hypothetical protein